MPNYNKQRIGIDNIEIGMVLAEDVINSNGMMLIPKNTMITQKHIFRMNLYQILSAVIMDPEDNKEAIELSSTTPTTLIQNQFNESFTKFSQDYYKQEELIKQKLMSISEGSTINISDLFSLSDSLVNTLRTKSELFNFLYHLRAKDDFTYTHSLNVSMLCNIFGQWLHMTPNEIETLTVSGLLHDIGKTEIDKKILNKPGKLTQSEFEEIKKHSEIGYSIIKNKDLPDDIKLGILMHHEKIDGSGYPLGLKGKQIHDYAKIIAIADIYDAMTSIRTYHKRFSPFKVIQMFEQESYGILDTKYLFVFLENIAHHYLGKKVKLSTGAEGKIVFIHKMSPSRPIVQVDNTMLDLLNEPSVTIEEIL